MIYNFVYTFIILNIIYEIIEIIFPIKKMNMVVKSFVLMITLYAMCEYIFSLF